MTSRQDARSTKRPSIFQCLKTTSVSYRFYFFDVNLPKFSNFRESMTKSYLKQFKIHRESAFYSLQKIVLDSFPQTFFI